MLMTPQQTTLVRESFAKVVPIREQAAMKSSFVNVGSARAQRMAARGSPTPALAVGAPGLPRPANLGRFASKRDAIWRMSVLGRGE